MSDINNLDIITSEKYSDFPNIFQINLNHINNEMRSFEKIKNDEYHPIASDNIYTVNTDGKVIKVNHLNNIEVKKN
jgi:hypothetical protein